MSLPLCFLLFLIQGIAMAESLLTPYQPDAHTLHLWHLDEAKPPFRDVAAGGTPLLGLHNGARPSQAACLGLGHSVSFHHHVSGTPGQSSLAGAVLTAAPTLAGDKSDNAPAGFRFQGDTGAFTYEALLKFDLLPAESPAIALDILTMDGESDDRVFSFRVEREGFLSFVPLPESGSAGGALASIPTQGPHAINTRDWFHVAVRYTGRPGIPGALQLFWTRIGSGANSAQQIGSGMLTRNLPPTLADFAIGNEARNSTPCNAEAEPFPGLIDEVRLSSVARHPTDFLFVPERDRRPPEASFAEGGNSTEPDRFKLQLTGVNVDGEAIDRDGRDGALLRLKPGLHRLDFDIGVISGARHRQAQLRCQLEGFDEHWQESTLGMSLGFEFLDEQRKAISQAQFNMTGNSLGWGTGISDSNLTDRQAPLFAPEKTRFLKVTLSSGAPDTSGSLALDDLHLVRPDQPDKPLWTNGGFEEGVNVLAPMRAPTGWQRGGEEPAIALVAKGNPSMLLCLLDGDQSRSGKWTAIQSLDPDFVGGRALVVSWREAYNIIPGNQQRATFLNVPAGSYQFRAVGITDDDIPASASLSMPLFVEPHFWQRAWFVPVATALGVSLVAIAIIRHRARRNRRRLREFALQTAVERDRTRIARDMHDDLGTRISVLNVTASLANQYLDKDATKARHQLEKMATAARELVVAMDELVWAVDPAHDDLDGLALQLTRHAQDVFHESEVRYRLDIPSSLPRRTLNSDLRHHISMAVREAFHNILKHAGRCQATMRVSTENNQLLIEIRDDGRGFEHPSTSRGNGLHNIESRLRELGGVTEIESYPAGGTTIHIRCPLP
ncbi:histidine kinase [Haloferula sargassicola]|uniref:Histidine kinase domain-containing protein n=1 Tax=Haloferula sargassicola TaxID=490096 RepID=A0ABP9UXH4_9BACT